jgi:hypothetical protein
MKIIQTLLLFVFIFLLKPQFARAQENAKLDVSWKVVSCHDSTLIVQLAIRTNKSGEKIKNANFAFEYNANQLAFARKDSEGVNKIDYFWQNGFESSDTIFTTVTRLVYSQLSVNIYFSRGSGIPISSETQYIPVINLKFKILKPGSLTKLTLLMEKTHPPTFDNAFDNHKKPFDEGYGWNDPLIVKLKDK